MDEPRNLLKQPTKKIWLIFTALSMIGIFLLLLSMSNLFTESIFKDGFMMLHFLILFNAFFVIKLNYHYFKNKTQNGK